MLKYLLALRYLKKRKLVILSITAVGLSCALLIVVASMFTGYINAIDSAATKHFGDIILEPGAGLNFPRYRELTKMLEADENIDSAAGILIGTGLVHLKAGNVKPVVIQGIDAQKYARVTNLGETLDAGSGVEDVEFSDCENILCGFAGIGLLTEPDAASDKYDMQKAKDYVGSKVVITTAARKSYFDESLPQPLTMQLKVLDVVLSGIHEIDSGVIYVPIEKLHKIIYAFDKDFLTADTIHIKCTEGVNPDEAVADAWRIWNKFADEKLNWSPPLSAMANVQTAVEKQQYHTRELQKQMQILLIIFGIISTGIVLLIICIFYMIVMTRRRDIAILRSLGLSASGIAGLYIFFGMAVGIIGGAVGLAAGYLLVVNVETLEHIVRQMFNIRLWSSSVYMFEKIPNRFNWLWAVRIFITAVCATTVGALWPAIWAARMLPVKILNYE